VEISHRKFIVCQPVRWKCAQALGMLGDKKGTDALIRALNDEDQYVCAAATRSLGHIKAENAAGSLVNVLKDESWLTRLNAREALLQIGKPVVEQLIAAAFSGRLDKVLTQHFIREAIIRN